LPPFFVLLPNPDSMAGNEENFTTESQRHGEDRKYRRQNEECRILTYEFFKADLK
jgi:hypothetical protein